MVSKRALTRVCAVAALALAGCSSHHSATTRPGLIADPDSPIADAPVPAGFRMMVGQSSSQVMPGSSLRFVDHSYSGSSSQLQVVRFYRDVMPEQGWAFLSQGQAHKEISLRFSKNNEDAMVSVWPGTFATHIRIKIDPVPQPAAK